MWIVGKAQEAIRKPKGGHAQLLCKDVKSAFLLVTLEKEKAAIQHTKAARWIPHISTFLAPREFAIGWDKQSEAGRATLYNGAPQGSPLSPILFLIFLAPMLQEVEERFQASGSRVKVYLISYVDDISVLVTSPRGWKRGPEAAQAVCEAIRKVNEDLNKVATAHGIIFAPEKEEILTFRAGSVRSGPSHARYWACGLTNAFSSITIWSTGPISPARPGEHSANSATCGKASHQRHGGSYTLA